MQDETPKLNREVLDSLGRSLSKRFERYASDRRIAELQWSKNLRQTKGLYDPEVERGMDPKSSRAYPRLTRAKGVSTRSRLINMMFNGTEKNWTLDASTLPDISMEDMQVAMENLAKKRSEMGLDAAPEVEEIEAEIIRLSRKKAKRMEDLLEDQLSELGGDQTADYVSLITKVIDSGITYGTGIMRGPFVRKESRFIWTKDQNGKPVKQEKVVYKPQFENIPIWDFYPDLSCKRLSQREGFFQRYVMSRHELRKLADRPDFELFSGDIKNYLREHSKGNYKPQQFETDIRSMGVTINTSEMSESNKYEVIVWHGYISGKELAAAGAELTDEQLSDEIQSEVWLLDGKVINATMNPWVELGVDIETCHIFLFDEDDSSPLGNGLPYIMRDSAMGVANATRMMMDNADVTCQPSVELDIDQLRADQDLGTIGGGKIYYKESGGMGAASGSRAVQNVTIDSHIPEYLQIIELFMRFADMETFVSPANGGDMSRGPSEPFRTSTGASQLRGDAALPFRDVVRNFDSFTQSVIYSLVAFNRKLNPDPDREGDFNVIARGATSLVAKEVRGMQLDSLVQTLTPGELINIDQRALARERIQARDIDSRTLLLPEDEVKRKEDQQSQSQAEQEQLVKEGAHADIRKTLSDALKAISQSGKNNASAEATQINSLLDALEAGLNGKGEGSGAGGGKANAQPNASKPRSEGINALLELAAGKGSGAAADLSTNQPIGSPGAGVGVQGSP